jgi:hypothetical protein
VSSSWKKTDTQSVVPAVGVEGDAPRVAAGVDRVGPHASAVGKPLLGLRVAAHRHRECPAAWRHGGSLEWSRALLD